MGAVISIPVCPYAIEQSGIDIIKTRGLTMTCPRVFVPPTHPSLRKLSRYSRTILVILPFIHVSFQQESKEWQWWALGQISSIILM